MYMQKVILFLLFFISADMYASELIVTDQVSDERKTEEEEIYSVVDEKPDFPGGEKALMDFVIKNLKYPPKMAKKKIQGRVFVSYIVETDGSISNIEVLKSPAKELSDEAVRVISLMPKWKPGTKGGNPVRVKYIMPVSFTIH